MLVQDGLKVPDMRKLHAHNNALHGQYRDHVLQKLRNRSYGNQLESVNQGAESGVQLVVRMPLWPEKHTRLCKDSIP